MLRRFSALCVCEPSHARKKDSFLPIFDGCFSLIRLLCKAHFCASANLSLFAFLYFALIARTRSLLRDTQRVCADFTSLDFPWRIGGALLQPLSLLFLYHSFVFQRHLPTRTFCTGLRPSFPVEVDRTQTAV